MVIGCEQPHRKTHREKGSPIRSTRTRPSTSRSSIPGVLDHPVQLREPCIQTVWRVIHDGTELRCVQARDESGTVSSTSPNSGHNSASHPLTIRPDRDHRPAAAVARYARISGLVVVYDTSRAGW